MSKKDKSIFSFDFVSFVKTLNFVGAKNLLYLYGIPHHDMHIA